MSATPVRILVVDDEPPIRKLLRLGLNARGYDVHEAANGKSGLDMLAKKPDLVILDLGLADIDGLTLLEAIRQRCDSLPIIVLSSRGDEAGKVAALDLGADDYVTKPIDFDVLDAIIKAPLAHVARTEIWVRDIQLNDREIETLTWVARGKTSLEIAQILNLSKRTVDFHIDNARNKLGVSTRTEAAIKAVTGRLIEP